MALKRIQKELNEINKTLLTIRDDESDYCCICINTENDIFVKLKCCNQSIHETSIIEFITSINNELYNCPICRKHLNTQVSFGKLIDYINENFYPVKLDAETKGNITFKGNTSTTFVNQLSILIFNVTEIKVQISDVLTFKMEEKTERKEYVGVIGGVVRPIIPYTNSIQI